MDKKNNMFSNNLKSLRELNGMSQQELAEKIHVTRQTISTWELRMGKPDIYALSDLCDLFGVTPTTMLRENVLKDDIPDKELIVKQDFPDAKYTYELNCYLDEDLEELMPILKFDFERIMVTALALHRNGYRVIEVFDNGFNVLTKSTDPSDKLDNEIKNIAEKMIHGDDDFINEQTDRISNQISAVKADVMDQVMTAIIGRSPDSADYYWVDETGTTRGYGDTELECRKQAQEQYCNWYKVMKRV